MAATPKDRNPSGAPALTDGLGIVIAGGQKTKTKAAMEYFTSEIKAGRTSEASRKLH
ncbi:MAG: hypothetical protein IT380_20890 [Myxococcales bacterium]|nr:hypothetical protein [Myxococcales bacterium]